MAGGEVGELEVGLAPIESPGSIEAAWRAVEAVAAPSYFQTFGWIGTWLELLPGRFRPQLLTVHDRGRPVGAGVLVERQGLGRGAAHLQATGDYAIDVVWPEDNGVLAERGREAEIAAAAFAELRRLRPDLRRIGLVGVRARDLEGLAAYHQDERFRHPLHEADLGAMRAAGWSYLETLDQRTRRNLRQSLRRLEEIGPLRMDSAGDVTEALAWLDRMGELNRSRLTATRGRSSFDLPFFVDFHRTLIGNRFVAGEIRMMRVSAGGREVGYVYGLRTGEALYTYQVGFDYDWGTRLQPGMVTHAVIAEALAAGGVARFNLMSGEGNYKHRLAPAIDEVVWVNLHRSPLAAGLHGGGRRLRGRLRRGLGELLRRVRAAGRG
jgi:CelD/BcsL family acetyltransferase involved in cellulose biosynthesis